MNELSSILSKIKEQNHLINTEVDPDSPTTRIQLDNQRNAVNRVAELKIEYRNLLLDRTVFIVMYGANSQKLASIAEKDFGSFAANAETVIDRIVAEIPSDLYLGREASPSLLDYVSHVLEGVAAEAGVVSFPYPVYKSQYARKLLTKEDLKKFVTEIVSQEIGSELVAIHAVTATFLKALEAEFEGKIYPVVLSTDNVEYAKTLVNDIGTRLNRSVFTLTVGDESGTAVKIQPGTIVLKSADKKNLTTALTKIKKELGGK